MEGGGVITEFVDRFMSKKAELRESFIAAHPEEYIDIVRSVISILVDENDYDCPDPSRIHQIDDGDYQGTLVFVIAARGYQPSDYWFVKVSYGSCSGCDTLESIRGYSDDAPTESEVDDYMTLALHIVQGIKKMEGYNV